MRSELHDDPLLNATTCPMLPGERVGHAMVETTHAALPSHLQRLGVSLRVQHYPFIRSDLSAVWRVVFAKRSGPREDAVRLLLTVAMPMINTIEEKLACTIPPEHYQPSSGYFGAVAVELALGIADQIVWRLHKDTRGAEEGQAHRHRRYASPADLVHAAVVLAVHWYSTNYIDGDWATDPTLHAYHLLRAKLEVDAPLGVGRTRFSAGEVTLNRHRHNLCGQLKLPVYACDYEVYRAVQQILASDQWDGKVDTLRKFNALYAPCMVPVRETETEPFFDDDVDVEHYFPHDHMQCVFDVLHACDYNPGGPLVPATTGMSPLVVCMCLLGNRPRCAEEAARVVLTFSTQYAPAPAAPQDYSAVVVLGCLAWYRIDAQSHVVPHSIASPVTQALLDFHRCA